LPNGAGTPEVPIIIIIIITTAPQSPSNPKKPPPPPPPTTTTTTIAKTISVESAASRLRLAVLLVRHQEMIAL